MGTWGTGLLSAKKRKKEKATGWSRSLNYLVGDDLGKEADSSQSKLNAELPKP